MDTFSMTEFMRLVNKANWTFNLAKSSLGPLIAELGGPVPKGTKNDIRGPFQRDHLIRIQNIIWQIGVQEDPWSKKKLAYKKPLGYLVHELFNVLPEDALLLAQPKNWTSFLLRDEIQLVHGSGVTLKKVHQAGGLSPNFASEFIFPEGGYLTDWPQNKYLFFFLPAKDAEGNIVPKGVGAQNFFGFKDAKAKKKAPEGADIFVITMPAGTRYKSKHDAETTARHRSEIVFDGLIPIARIAAYRGGQVVPLH